ncbi:hypothetical protein INR49_012429 [Caranx melampygus]|nr:hypothetical protein INR49_012429 [Caranx melampygus]
MDRYTFYKTFTPAAVPHCLLIVKENRSEFIVKAVPDEVLYPLVRVFRDTTPDHKVNMIYSKLYDCPSPEADCCRMGPQCQASASEMEVLKVKDWACVTSPPRMDAEKWDVKTFWPSPNLTFPLDPGDMFPGHLQCVAKGHHFIN